EQLADIYRRLDEIETRKVDTVTFRPKTDRFWVPLAAMTLLSMLTQAVRLLLLRGAGFGVRDPHERAPRLLSFAAAVLAAHAAAWEGAGVAAAAGRRSGEGLGAGYRSRIAEAADRRRRSVATCDAGCSFARRLGHRHCCAVRADMAAGAVALRRGAAAGDDCTEGNTLDAVDGPCVDAARSGARETGRSPRPARGRPDRADRL